LIDDILEIPALYEKYDTAFLEVSLMSFYSGFLFQPHVNMYHGNVVVDQYVEFGAKGLRYLNVSEFVRNGSSTINIDCHRCKFSTKEFRLILYRNLEVDKENILILSTHPDDAEIAAYGLYSSNKNTFIATITAGDAGEKNYDELYDDERDHYLKKGELRFWNSITVPLLAGLNHRNIINLGYFDASLEKMALNNTEIIESEYTGVTDVDHYRSKNISSFLDPLKSKSNWLSLVNDIKFILQKINPTIIVTPYPLIDNHVDHKYTTVALFQAMRELNYKDSQLWLYTNHHPYSEYYPDGRIGSLVSLPPYSNDVPIYFDKIYSHTLPKSVQSDKMLALDAMNDLRLDTEWQSIAGSFFLLVNNIFKKIDPEGFSFYRRSVRSNEIFFVVSSDKIFDDETRNMIVGNLKYIE
jgi:hypothetical protein